MGELTKALEHGDKLLALYHVERHRHLVDLLNHDPRTAIGTLTSLAIWMLGDPDRAVRVSHENDAHARRRAHPFDLGWALYMGAEAFEYRCEPEKVRLRAEECERLGREDSRRSRGNFVLQPVSPDCGKARASARKR